MRGPDEGGVIVRAQGRGDANTTDLSRVRLFARAQRTKLIPESVQFVSVSLRSGLYQRPRVLSDLPLDHSFEVSLKKPILLYNLKLH